VGFFAALGVLGTALDVTLGRPAGDVAGATLGLGVVAVGLARCSRGARLTASPPPGSAAGQR
jgi:hypothetical protein